MKHISLCVLLALLAPASAGARTAARGAEPVRTSDWSAGLPRDPEEGQRSVLAVHASAPATALVLASYELDSGYTCTAEGWTTVDLTAQTGDYWHADDFTTAPWAGTSSYGGISCTPVQGS